jgi:chemotaxis protein CheD
MSDAGAGIDKVRMGEFLVREAPAKLAIYGLGSCVAVFVYETERRIAALAHVLLPAPTPGTPRGPAGKYADTAVAAILGIVLEMGGRREALIAKVAGGAHMFSATPSPDRETLGERNIRAALEALKRHGLEVAGMDIGGAYGRTIVADAATGTLVITSLKREPKRI